MADDAHARGYYMVLCDGETFMPLAGSTIVTISPGCGDDADAAVTARCRDGDLEAGAGVDVVCTFPEGAPPRDLALASVGELPPDGRRPRGSGSSSGEPVGERLSVVLHFLGARGALSDETAGLADLLARASTEDLVLHEGATAVEPLDGPTLARLAIAAGSEPGFFGLAPDGAPLEPDAT